MKERFAEMLLNIWYGIFEKFFWIFPIDSKKVVCSSYCGRGYGDNPKYIAEELHRRASEYKIIWLVKNTKDNNFPSWVKLVKCSSVSQLYNLATAGIWIDNCRKHYTLKRRKNQKYIQTWHGGTALKKVEGDAPEKLERVYLKNAVQDTKNATLFISNGSWCTEWLRRAFWYNGKIIECGTPRDDILFNITEVQKKEIRHRLSVPDDARIVIYAPTFRVTKSLDAYTLDYEKLKTSLEKRFGGNWYILLRLHPNLKGVCLQSDFDFTLEVTNYPDMYELLAVSDFLITDYSSTMFEFSYVNKPVVLFATDVEDYMNDRGTYFKFDELPYPLAQSNSELEEILCSWDNEKYICAQQKFAERLGIIENGHASEKIAYAIINGELE